MKYPLAAFLFAILLMSPVVPVLAQAPRGNTPPAPPANNGFSGVRTMAATGSGTQLPPPPPGQLRQGSASAKLNNMNGNVASREAQFKQKIGKFRNKNKATIAERVNTNLNQINAKRTQFFSMQLDKMSDILETAQGQVQLLSQNGTDTTAVDAAVSDAQTAIDNARIANTAQSQKDYTMIITSESQVKKDAQSSRDQLQNDLNNVQKLMVEARQSLSSVISAFNSLKGGN